ncbi:MAG: MBL fold metallo-hydrolase [Anaerolineae bacterium]
MTVEAVLLGVAQDAGVPQIGCDCPNCRAARAEPGLRQMAVSLALVDHAASASWIIDATPNFPAQYDWLRAYAPDCPLHGILLTHAHVGHYLGLAFLGREGMNAKGIRVYATAEVGLFLSDNAPWSQLVATHNIDVCEIKYDAPLRLTESLSVTPIPVPHRAEFSDTVAYLVAGPAARLFYCPDIDGWDRFRPDLAQFLADVDVALLDGTFFNPEELPGRDLSQIPHPMVVDTVNRLAERTGQTIIIHLNHTNPLLRDSQERAWLRAQSIGVGFLGMAWSLG